MSFHPAASVSDEAALLDTLRARVPRIVHRAPEAGDDTRFHPLRIDGRNWRLARPTTFTPYASTRPCSARCAFCSENLRTERGGVPAARLRPDARYFTGLARALAALRGVPLSWSLSGLENTDDPVWLLQLLDTLRAAERDGVAIDNQVLYSNGAGFAHAQGTVLRDALLRFGLGGIELSRHHHNDATNQALIGREAVGCEIDAARAPQIDERFARLGLAPPTVFAAACDTLADGAFCIAMAQNLRLGKRMLPLAFDLARILGSLFVLQEERVIVYDRGATQGPACRGPCVHPLWQLCALAAGHGIAPTGRCGPARGGRRGHAGCLAGGPGSARLRCRKLGRARAAASRARALARPALLPRLDRAGACVRLDLCYD